MSRSRAFGCPTSIVGGLVGIAGAVLAFLPRSALSYRDRSSKEDQIQEFYDCLLGAHRIAEHHFLGSGVEEEEASEDARWIRAGLEAPSPVTEQPRIKPLCAFFLTANVGSFAASRYGISAIKNVELLGSKLLDDLESLEYINRTISAKLRVLKDSKGNLVINRRMFSLLGEPTCIYDVKRRIRDLRKVLKTMNNGAMVWAKRISKHPPADVISPSIDMNHGCEGRNLDPKLLGDFGEVVDPDVVGGWCREFSMTNKTLVRHKCAEKCLQIDECAGVTWYDDKVDEEITGSRCCFRSATTQRFEQNDTACFVASRARFLDLDAKGLHEWLVTHGHGKIANKSLDFGANGALLQGITKSKTKEWLGPMSDAEALELRCRIDAELLGTPHRHRMCGLKGLTARSLAAFKRVAKKVEPIGFAVRGYRGAWIQPWWKADLARRLLPESWVAHQIVTEGLSAYYTIVAMRCIRDAVESYFGADEFYSQIGLGISAAALAGKISESYWDNCPKVRSLLDQKLSSPYALLALSGGKKMRWSRELDS